MLYVVLYSRLTMRGHFIQEQPVSVQAGYTTSPVLSLQHPRLLYEMTEDNNKPTDIQI